MTTLEPGALLPDALAARLAGHYAPNATCGLAVLHWTGRVSLGMAREVVQRWIGAPGSTANGQCDPNAVAAELRALEHYCRVHEGRGEVDGWRDWDPFKAAAATLVVPWSWREPAEARP